MHISTEQYKKLKDFFTSFSEDMSVLRRKRAVLLRAYMEKKAKRAQKEILEKIIRM